MAADAGYQQWLGLNRACIASSGTVTISLGMSQVTLNKVSDLDNMAEALYPTWLQSNPRAAPVVSQTAGKPIPAPAAPVRYQPAALRPALKAGEGWHETLHGCTNDVFGCLMAYFCQCWVYGDVSYKVGLHSSVGEGCASCLCAFNTEHFTLLRKTIRTRYGIVAESKDDLMHNSICTHICALCQEAREVDYRERVAQSYASPTAPPKHQYMA